MTPEDQIIEDQARALLIGAMETLSPRMQRILRLRFGFDSYAMTYKQIAQEFGLSHARVHFLVRKALKDMRSKSRLVMLAAGYEPASNELTRLRRCQQQIDVEQSEPISTASALWKVDGQWWQFAPRPGYAIHWHGEMFVREDDLSLLTADQLEFLQEAERKNGIVRLHHYV